MSFEFSYVKFSDLSSAKEVIDFCRSRDSIFQLLRCSSLISEEQVHIALDVMGNIKGKVNIADDGILLMLLLAGTNQIKVAEERVGIRTGYNEYLCVYANRKDLDEFINLFDTQVKLTQPVLPKKDLSRDTDTFMQISRARLMLLNWSAIST
jgi:tRNA threonylcarbamoyladenosine modification (KEOPS) complex Cgi121 subunit